MRGGEVRVGEGMGGKGREARGAVGTGGEGKGTDGCVIIAVFAFEEMPSRYVLRTPTAMTVRTERSRD